MDDLPAGRFQSPLTLIGIRPPASDTVIATNPGVLFAKRFNSCSSSPRRASIAGRAESTTGNTRPVDCAPPAAISAPATTNVKKAKRICARC